MKSILLYFARARGLQCISFFLILIGFKGCIVYYNTVLDNSYDNIL
jgi:hypothetical protein